MHRKAHSAQRQAFSTDETLCSPETAARLLRVPMRVINDLIAANKIKTQRYLGRMLICLEAAQAALAEEGDR